MRARRTFSSLRYRNYRLFFAGQAVSQVGSWMQRFALGWFVLQLTNDPFAVGLMALAQFLPFTLFGLFAGVITDRLDARRLVIGTQAAQLVTASALDVDRVRRLRAAVDALHDRVRERARARARRSVAPAADIPDGRAGGAAERDRAQLERLQRVADLRARRRRASSTASPARASASSSTRSASSRCCSGCFAMRTRDFFPLEEFERPSILRGTREGLAYVRKQPRMLILLGLTVDAQHVLLQLQRHAAGAREADAARRRDRLRGPLGRLRRGRARRCADRSVARTRVGEGDARRRRSSSPARSSCSRPCTADSRRRPALLRRRGLRGLVGELEHVDAARRARPAARPHHRHLLLRVQRHRPGRRACWRAGCARRAERSSRSSSPASSASRPPRSQRSSCAGGRRSSSCAADVAAAAHGVAGYSWPPTTIVTWVYAGGSDPRRGSARGRRPCSSRGLSCTRSSR